MSQRGLPSVSRSLVPCLVNRLPADAAGFAIATPSTVLLALGMDGRGLPSLGAGLAAAPEAK